MTALIITIESMKVARANYKVSVIKHGKTQFVKEINGDEGDAAACAINFACGGKWGGGAKIIGNKRVMDLINS